MNYTKLDLIWTRLTRRCPLCSKRLLFGPIQTDMWAKKFAEDDEPYVHTDCRVLTPAKIKESSEYDRQAKDRYLLYLKDKIREKIDESSSIPKRSILWDLSGVAWPVLEISISVSKPRLSARIYEAGMFSNIFNAEITDHSGNILYELRRAENIVELAGIVNAEMERIESNA